MGIRRANIFYIVTGALVLILILAISVGYLKESYLAEVLRKTEYVLYVILLINYWLLNRILIYKVDDAWLNCLTAVFLSVCAVVQIFLINNVWHYIGWNSMFAEFESKLSYFYFLEYDLQYDVCWGEHRYTLLLVIMLVLLMGSVIIINDKTTKSFNRALWRYWEDENIKKKKNYFLERNEESVVGNTAYPKDKEDVKHEKSSSCSQTGVI